MPRVQHIVLLQFKTEIASEQIDSVFKELAALKDSIEGLVSFSGGAYSSPEGFNKNWTHAFTMVFDTEGSRDAYLPHPEVSPSSLV